jgi:hypothetical protein
VRRTVRTVLAAGVQETVVVTGWQGARSRAPCWTCP